jgi:hypothetical protein
LKGENKYFNLKDEFWWDSEPVGNRIYCDGVPYKKENKKAI